MNMLRRWKYRFIVWFIDKPDSLDRRVQVENVLLAHFKNKTSPTQQECKDMAMKLGVPSRWHKKEPRL